MTRQALRVASFVVAIAFCLTPFASPPIALAIGIVVGLGLGHPFPERNGAITRVLLDSTDGEQSWTTIGVSENIIEASWQALSDSIVYGLLRAEIRG